MQNNSRIAISIVTGGVIAIGAASLWYAQSGASPRISRKADVEAIVRDYILEHPEIIPQAIERYR
ncbi:MAG: DsbA family protein, partial [Alphaproteobacteria bacterium]